MTLCAGGSEPCTTDCKAYLLPIGACFSPPALFPGDEQWGKFDVLDVCHSHFLNRSFFASEDGSCRNRTDGFVVPLDECVGPFGLPRPEGTFSCPSVLPHIAQHVDSVGWW